MAGGYNFKLILWNPVSHFLFRKKLLSAGNISIMGIENAALQRIKLNGIFCAYMIVELAGEVTDGGNGIFYAESV